MVCLAYSADSRFLVSGASDRFISLWDSSFETDNTVALKTFTLDSSPTQVCHEIAPCPSTLLSHPGSQISLVGGTGESMQMLAVSEGGSVSVWRFSPPKG